MHLLVMTTREDRSRDRITEEAGKKGFEVTQLYYEDINPRELRKEDFLGYDFFIPRDPYNTGHDLSGILRKVLPFFRDEQILDCRVFGERPGYEDKLMQHKTFGNIMEMPGFWYFDSPGDVDITSFPVIAKKRISSRGRGIFIIRDRKDLERFLKESDVRNYLFEEYVRITKDVRVLIIGNEIIGSVERRVRIKDNKGYDGIGVRMDREYELPGGVRKAVMEVYRESRSDICGIDFMIDKEGKAYLIECNISPQFVAFERVLGKNAAGMLIDMIASKVKSVNYESCRR